MGGDAVKGEVGTHNGHTAPGTDLVDGFRVPGVGEVHVVKIAGPGDELLGMMLVIAIDAANCSQNK